MDKIKPLVEQALLLAKKEGANEAEVSVSTSQGFTASVRLGEVDTVEYHNDNGFDITVYKNQCQGSASTSDLSPSAIESAVKKACLIAGHTGEDPCHGLADKTLLAKNYDELDLYHPWNIDVNKAIQIAKECEEAGRQFNANITNSEGASVSQYEGRFIYGNSNGFLNGYASTRHGINCVLLAEGNDNKERDYEYTQARDPRDLQSPQWVGEEAARKTLARLNGRKLSTRNVPVIFAPRIAAGLLGNFVAAIRGSSIYRQASFLVGALNKQIFPQFITISEDPLIPKAVGSAPFDNEGVATQKRWVIEKGVLNNYILNSYAARKLGLQTTGNAGGVRNLMIDPTAGNLEELLKKMDTGLLVTELMGQGVNIITGDYSRGASGFWVENGKIQYPVHEITIAGNLQDMFLNLVAAGNDVDKRGSIWSGSLLIEQMTVAGE
ncbi:MAG: metalloprotease PmbA [Gammaproteobacteria bacterium]|nr:metalloprotease PmbA [Gammaproteobacteria bacterium]